MPINPGHSKEPVRSMAAENRQGNTCWGSAYGLLNSASGRSNANMARSVKVPGGGPVNGQPFRLPGEHRVYSDCTAQMRASINEKALSDMTPGPKHAYSTVPPTY